MMNAKNNKPSQQRKYVKSATQRAFGRCAVKSRATRSDGGRNRICSGCPPRLAASLRTPDPVIAHQPLHLAARATLADAQQRLPRPAVTVGLVVLLVRLSDHREQPLILDGPRRALTARALIVGGRRHAQGPTDRLDPEATAMLVDVAAHLVRSVSSSLAKNTEADLRISFARRSS
jgi:hypothetical protein